MQFDRLGQSLLGDPPQHPFAADIGPEFLELLGLLVVERHALLRRQLLLTDHATTGRNIGRRSTRLAVKGIRTMAWHGKAIGAALGSLAGPWGQRLECGSATGLIRILSA
jgi:hypothetical protein